jgi:hypothetical protein
MDLTLLAKELAVFLAPFTPYLVSSGEKAVTKIVEKVGEDSWQKIKSMWSKLAVKLEAKPAALEAINDLAAEPSRQQAQTVFAWQVEKVLSQDQRLVAELGILLEQAMSSAKGPVIASGERNVVGGRDIKDSVIITGNQNTAAVRRDDGSGRANQDD